ncbi:MAG: carbohydrate kinase family protein [Chloroflexi bacterium]|jgi:sugar/nucleoside kinase (ribokinase family)|nr:carbohydrate kinase family protein [Chloroflexota bacterium]
MIDRANRATPTPLIVCVGDLIDEIAVRLDAPWRRGSDAAAQITRRRGGSAANVAVAAVAAGGSARFIGAVGDDATAEALEAALLRAGVEPLLQRGGRSASIVVVVEPDGERTMLPDRAAALSLRDPGPAALIGGSWLHAPAYSLLGEPLGETTSRLFAHARDAGIPTSLDASSVGALSAWGPEESRRRFAELAPTLLFANEEECAYLDLINRPLPGSALIAKHGAGIAEVRSPEGEHVAALPAHPLPPGIDSTGAGDAFAGGLLVARARGESWEDALAAGHTAAAGHLQRQATESDQREAS